MDVRHPPADFHHDVADPENIAAERAVLAYMRSRHWPVLDVSGQHLAWDFVLYHGDRPMHIDAKAEEWTHRTWRISFEEGNLYRDGSWRDTWGRNDELDLIAVVAIPSPLCFFVSLPGMREVVARNQPHEKRVPFGWARIDCDNPRSGYRTQGWAIPMATLFAHNAVVHVAQVPGGDLCDWGYDTATRQRSLRRIPDT